MQPQPSLRSQVLSNLAWLLGSFLLAVFVWFAAVNQQNPVLQQRFTGRISVKILKDESLLVVQQPDPVQVVVRAPRSVWDVLDASDILVTADLRGKAAGKWEVPLTAMLSANRLGEVSEIQPAEVSLELVKRSEAAFNISIVPLRPPPVGFEIGSTQMTEGTAKISGSESAVQRVAAVVARVDLTDQTKTITRTLPVIAIDGDGRSILDVTITPSVIEATINIQPRPGVTVMKVVPKLSTNTLPPGYLVSNYSADPVVVAVRGDRSVIESMAGVVETESVDLANKSGPFTQTVKLALPSGVTLTDPVNVVVSVQIEAVNITREFANIPVQAQGLDASDFSISIQPQTVNVIVKGPLQAVNALQANEITVTAPLAGLAGGTHTVTLQASVAHAGLTGANVSIPNPEARVVVTALNPTPTSTITRTPVATATMAPTASVTP